MTALSLYDASTIVSEAGKTLVLGHVSPDGDCLGSAFALGEIIRMCGGSADLACDGTVPGRLSFIGDGVLSPSDVSADGYDTIISVDVASPSQLGSLSALIPNIRLMIDHHSAGEPFADNLIISTASAAGEIIYLIYKELVSRGIVCANRRVERLVYTAIVSDTGSFKYSNTTAETHSIAAELVGGISAADDGGLDTSDISRLLFGRFTVREMRAKMLAIQNMRLLEDGRLGIVVFTKNMLAENSLDEGDIGNAVETPRCIDGVYVALSIRESGDGQYKVSSRANADIDVSAVCAKFGGGGHVRAAGCTIAAQSAEEAETIALSAFGEAVCEYIKTSPQTKARI